MQLLNQTKLKVIVGILVVVGVLCGLCIYTYQNPPLKWAGMTTYTVNETMFLFGVQNEGLFDVKLKEVYLNGSIANKVEVGTSRSDHLVLGANVKDDPDITFEELDGQIIRSTRYIKKVEQKGNSGVPRSYGLEITGESKPTQMRITYTYLGLPMSLLFDFK